jgi:YggT family protein
VSRLRPCAACAVPEPRLGCGPLRAGVQNIMGGFIVPVIEIIYQILNIYWWIIIITAVVSWLITFGVLNTYNRTVARILDVLYRLTEPVLRPIRQLLPNLGGIDVSPVILLLIIWFIQRELIQLEFHLYQF